MRRRALKQFQYRDVGYLLSDLVLDRNEIKDPFDQYQRRADQPVLTGRFLVAFEFKPTAEATDRLAVDRQLVSPCQQRQLGEIEVDLLLNG